MGSGSTRAQGGTYEISTPRRLEVLASPVRSEIVETLMRLGTSSIAEIAAAMDRSPESLYHHVKQLQAVGVIRVAGRRKAARRTERLFELTADDFRIDWSNRTPAFRRALARSARLLLERTARELVRSIEQPASDADRADEAGPPRHRFGRDVVRLSDRSLAELHRRLLELHEWLGTVDDSEAEHAIGLTVVLHPRTEED